jgi:hypothetical protein
MARDPIVDEVRRVRGNLAAWNGFDVKVNTCGVEKATRLVHALELAVSTPGPATGASFPILKA